MEEMPRSRESRRREQKEEVETCFEEGVENSTWYLDKSDDEPEGSGRKGAVHDV